MSNTPIEPTAVTPTEAQPTASAPAESPAAAATPAPVPTEPKGNVWDDPKAAQAEIESLRRENAKRRVDAKSQVDEARTELAQTIGKALGLVKDEPIDPVKLTESLTTSQAEAKQARVELAVFRNAATAGADPAALLDSTTFLKSVESIDPSDSAAITAAIASAIETNPRLGVSTGVQPPAPNPAQGSSAAGPGGVAQMTRADIERLAREGKHAEIDKARADGRLNDALGIK